jgi:hypothetical protein
MDQTKDHLLQALEDLNEQQRYFQTGTCNHIAYTAVHMMTGLDRTVNTLFQDKPQIWEAKGYREKLGFEPEGRYAGLTHEQAASFRVEPWNELVNYVREVLDSVLDYLNNASDEDLNTEMKDARIDSFRPHVDASRLRVLRGRVTHVSMHMGELYAIRGFLGLKGSPV